MSAFAAPAVAPTGALPGGLDPATVPTLTAAAAAVLGAAVAYQAYRGYRRNASRAMLYLTAGVLLLTTVPFAVRWALVAPGIAGTTMGELAAQLCRIAGLLVVLYVLAGGSDGGGTDASRSAAGGPGDGRPTPAEGADEVRDEGPAEGPDGSPAEDRP